MRPLQLRGKAVSSVFELIGSDENSLTFAFGWCLSQVEGFLEAVTSVLETASPSAETIVLLQEYGGKHGITDVEVVDHGHLAIIFEAKVGFYPPSLAQLSKYAAHLNDAHRDAKRLLVVIAQSDRRELWLKVNVPSEIEGIPLKVLSWRQIRRCAEETYERCGHRSKQILRQFDEFLGKVLPMQDTDSNEAYVVSLSPETFGGGKTSFIEVVTNYQKYFHPIAPGWPSNPPNYMAFRWSGRLQSIHHVDDYEVITSWKRFFPDIEADDNEPRFLYHLGPPILPRHEVRTGSIYRAGRVWAAIDLLLTCTSISEARERTKKRKAEAADVG